MMFSGLIPAFTKSVYTRQGSFVLFFYTNDYTSDGVITPPISSSENHGILLCQRKSKNKHTKQGYSSHRTANTQNNNDLVHTFISSLDNRCLSVLESSISHIIPNKYGVYSRYDHFIFLYYYHHSQVVYSKTGSVNG